MRRTTLTAALGLTLVLAGCATESDDGTGDTTGSETGTTADQTSTEDAGGDDSDATAGSTEATMDDPVCAGFFQTGPVTLAERAQQDRDVLASGETLDPASFGEITLLNGRIVELGKQADADQAALLERINVPFVEATQAVVSDEDQSPTDDEITVPQIEVTDSGAAQDELEAACAG